MTLNKRMMNLENFVYLYESASVGRTLEGDPSKIKEWLYDHAWQKLNIDKQALEKFIDDVCKYYEENKNLGKPFVLGYNDSGTTFALRRWVLNNAKNVNLPKELFETIPYIYSGFHNTSLKEDGVFLPSAQDEESLICLGYNTLYFPNDNMEEMAKEVKIDKKKIASMLQYFEGNSDFYQNIGKDIHKKFPDCGFLYKLPTGKTVTSEWKEKGKYKIINDKDGVNKTPKTDIIDKTGKYKLSLKKEKTGGQLMSGGYNETLATLATALAGISENDKKDIENRLKEYFGKVWDKVNTHGLGIAEIKKDATHHLHELIMNASNIQQKLQKELIDIFKKYPEYRINVFKEAASGEHKFGKDSPSCANYMLFWGINNDIEDVDEYVKKITKYEISVRFKTGKRENDSWQVLSIIPK